MLAVKSIDFVSIHEEAAPFLLAITAEGGNRFARPIEWDVKTGVKIKWKSKIGAMTFGIPVVANGLVWIGTNNENPRDPNDAKSAGVLMCFRETDGKFLYQNVSPARQGPAYNQAQTGISCSPLIEGDWLWFVTPGAEVLCLDIGPLRPR